MNFSIAEINPDIPDILDVDLRLRGLDVLQPLQTLEPETVDLLQVPPDVCLQPKLLRTLL